MGGKNTGAFSDEVMQKWIEKHNGPEGSPGFEAARDRFIRSCAGYCVATHVLGIGDRHNDNIMVKRTAEFFHIDFGHFLGNKKYQFNILRERTAFVLTPEMAVAMGGEGSEGYERFLRLSCEALQVLRRRADELVNLLLLMLPSGMPELRSRDDIGFVSEMLALGRSDEEAALMFRSEASKGLKDVFKRVDNQMHILAHA